LPAQPRGLIFDIHRYSVHDGPGIRTTVFFKGCPLACRWCHNPESQSPRPQLWYRPARCVDCRACLEACRTGAIEIRGEAYCTDLERCTLCGDCARICPSEARQIAGREMSVHQVLGEVLRDLPFYDGSGGGVTFSGGEPLLQPSFLAVLLKACRARGLHTALDTCGFAPWSTLDNLRDDVDLFLFDLKLVDEARHILHTGVSNRLILENLQRLSEAGHEILVRVPLIPGCTMDADNLSQIAAHVASLPRPAAIELLPYHHTAQAKYRQLEIPFDLAGLQPPTDEQVAWACDLIQSSGVQVINVP
jgi:pyruvate formate lyase activating enzyme